MNHSTGARVAEWGTAVARIQGAAIAAAHAPMRASGTEGFGGRCVQQRACASISLNFVALRFPHHRSLLGALYLPATAGLRSCPASEGYYARERQRVTDTSRRYSSGCVVEPACSGC